MNNGGQHFESFQEGVASFSHIDLKHTFCKAREHFTLCFVAYQQKLLSQERKSIAN